MSISRHDQARLSKNLLEIDRLSDRNDVTKKLVEISSLFLELSGFEDNGIAFDTSEYFHEKYNQQISGNVDTGWKQKAYDSLQAQLKSEKID